MEDLDDESLGRGRQWTRMPMLNLKKKKKKTGGGKKAVELWDHSNLCRCLGRRMELRSCLCPAKNEANELLSAFGSTHRKRNMAWLVS